MRVSSLALSFIAGLISVSPVWAAAPSCDPDHPPATIDPVFKLNLSSGFYAAHYAAAPASLLDECGISVSRAADYRYWIFGTVDQGADRYLILGGQVRDRTGTDTPKGQWSDDMFGSLDQISAGKCQKISWPLDIFCTSGMGPPPLSVVQELAEDVVKRYASAFGSKQAFITELKEQNRVPDDPGLKILNQALAAAP